MKLSAIISSLSLFISTGSALVPNSRPSFTQKQQVGEFEPMQVSPKKSYAPAVAAAVALSSPLVAMAEEVDDYEYGAVDAPIGIAVGGGILAILTALLPIALRGGEEAFEEMRERDSGNWGTGRSDSLDKRR